ncbi:hypothetical protein H4582DRAFT_362539 [Lactarius indigo]|nr:hypothetical protein H4582DRAFT_362539 [Lactarius indigo]
MRLSTTSQVMSVRDLVGRRKKRLYERRWQWTMRKAKRKKSSPRPPCPSGRPTAFTYNSANPNVAVSPSAPAATDTRQLAKKTSTETSRDSASVEVIVPLPTKRGRPQAVSSRNDDHLPVSPHGKGKHHPHTPTSPRRTRRRVADEHEQDESDDADAPRELRCVSRVMPYSPSGRQLHRHKPHRVAHQYRTSAPPPHKQSSPITPPDVNSLTGLPLTILPKSARTEIMIPPCTFGHLQAFPDLQIMGPTTLHRRRGYVMARPEPLLWTASSCRRRAFLLLLV